MLNLTVNIIMISDAEFYNKAVLLINSALQRLITSVIIQA